MNVGIDRINFYTPEFYLDLKDLAEARSVDPNKYLLGLMQKQMSVAPADQDSVTLAANAAKRVVDGIDKDDVGLIIFATESSIDQSKSGSLYLQELLKLSNSARSFEIKEACYGGTAALMSACDYVRTHPNKKALITASDIARYGLNTPGEVTQGAGAVAMIISKDPNIAAISQDNEVYSEQIMDFWRPNYQKNAIANGHYSQEKYLEFFKTVFEEYINKNKSDFAALLFHVPYSKLAYKAFKIACEKIDPSTREMLKKRFDLSIDLNQKVGNIYTASIYLSLISLIIQDPSLKKGDKLGLFSYGSGAVGDFFSIELTDRFKKSIDKKTIVEQIKRRKKLSIQEYEQFFKEQTEIEAKEISIEQKTNLKDFRFLGIKKDQRQYSH
ncbi:hydroxymethylglutaryl-CoA synthase [Oenococcus alcoholitolerans]|uniref:Hydroxymethylglutaryl-CoA synthase n=1 Tax=Oenococcus alcoholitolerans TaxID=931074 RepID=A0ABR4XS12_9LACO|nr:hydroxymethylglutaryl-CoA synthase [Oenococcus alcoholitolerans]